MNWARYSYLVLAMLLISGCASPPIGPSVMVLPAPGKPFDAFQADDYACRRWAEQQVGISPNAAAGQHLAGGAAAGTLLGAGLGAAIGAASGHPAEGAAVGAASGLLAGTAAASGPAYAAGAEVQMRYDNAYQQCMYSRGNQIPGVSRRGSAPPPPPPPGYTGPPADYGPGPYDAPDDSYDSTPPY